MGGGGGGRWHHEILVQVYVHGMKYRVCIFVNTSYTNISLTETISMRFVTGRIFDLQKHSSPEYPINYGVPLESVLVPTLFSVINTCPNTL